MASDRHRYGPAKGAARGPDPREQILSEGPRQASDADLLAAILGSGSASRRVHDMSARLLEDGGLHLLGHTSPQALLEIPSVGPAQACRVLAAVELGRRVWVRAGPAERPVRGPEDVQERCRGYAAARKEHFLALHLNTRQIVVREELVSVGSLNASIVHPREVFRSAILESAASLILVHNHPSGDPTPSDDDIRITMRLAEVGELVGIPLTDHVVLGESTYYSFRGSKLLK
ncbi:MAG: DNA repair protein RadC [Candidatus Eisenbacteria bacterium]|nr:DNA repair protein RadC [Candidatus Eisenbacteria bacterium]